MGEGRSFCFTQSFRTQAPFISCCDHLQHVDSKWKTACGRLLWVKPVGDMHHIKSHSITITWSQTLPNIKGPGNGNLAVCPEERRETWMLAQPSLPPCAVKMGTK